MSQEYTELQDAQRQAVEAVSNLRHAVAFWIMTVERNGLMRRETYLDLHNITGWLSDIDAELGEIKAHTAAIKVRETAVKQATA